MEIIIVIAVLVAAYFLWTYLTKEVDVPKDLVQANKVDDDVAAFIAPYKVPEPAATTPVPMFVPPVVAEPVTAPEPVVVAEPVAAKPKRKPAARTVAAKKPVAKAAPAKKTVAAKKPAAKTTARPKKA